jgi:EAL domain-containing protein (putative c-di-GMP-specific phosphodiesterase class I)
VAAPTLLRSGTITVPYLEHYPEQGGPAERVAVLRLPFVLGRSEDADHTIYSSKVSKEHASIQRIGDHYAIRDLDSTNGTFVNGERVTEFVLADGDIVHLAHVEFCFRHETPGQRPSDRLHDTMVDRTQAVASGRPDSIIRGSRLLRELIAHEAVEIVFQPIVDLRTHTIVGYEALGRGSFPGLARSPALLLSLADQCDLSIPLSELFRRVTIAKAARLPAGAKLFLNVHARELAGPAFYESLHSLRRLLPPSRPVVIEIAESSVTDIEAMARHKSVFQMLGFEFAYDDFGAGQARLLELADTPPNYLKLDMSLIHGIEQAKSRQDMVHALLQVVSALGVRIVAEGIESEEVAVVCRQLGCHFGQGYLFGRPE